jgi:hypothetical protein
MQEENSSTVWNYLMILKPKEREPCPTYSCHHLAIIIETAGV